MTADGFPIRDSLGAILAPLIVEFHADIRNRIYTPEVVVFSMVTGVLARDTSLNAAVIRNNADRQMLGIEPASTNTASFSEARSRLDVRVLIESAKKIAAKTVENASEGTGWMGFEPYAIDGTTLTAADTEANQEAFPQHGKQEEGVGFPLMRVVLLQSLKTGSICNVAYGPFQGKGTGEMALARELLPSISGKALLVGDRYFPSFFMMADLIKNGVQGVFQSHAARDVDFRRGRQIGVLDHLVEWSKPVRPCWMSVCEYGKYPDKILLREVDVTREVESDEKMQLVTTLLDNCTFSKTKLAKFYKKRWKIETALKDLKDTFGMGHIEAQTPEMIEKVLWSHFLAYNILRWHIGNAAALFGTEVENISVKTAARVLTENRGAIILSRAEDRYGLFSYLYQQMVRVPVGQRPGRSEPRAVKRRPKPFPRLHERRSDWHERKSA